METIRLGDACEILNGYAFKSENYVDSGIRVIRIANVQKGFIEDNTPAFYPLDSSGLEKYMLEEGDLLMSLTGNVGRVAILEKEFLPAALNQRVACLRLKTDRLTKGYLFHILNSDFFEQQCIQSSKGVAQKNMSTEWLKEYEIPLYSKEKQAELTSILDKTRNVIACRKQELQKLDELVKARFVEMFGDPISNPKGWKKEKAENHIDLLSGYPFQSEQYVDEGINICGGLIIMPQKIQWQDCKHWPSVDGFEDYLLAEDDIVMALDRPWISDGFKIAQVDSTHLPALLIQRTARIRSIDVNQQYLFHCFVNGGFDKHSNVTGSLVPHISAKDIRSFEILLPPIELQNRFAEFAKQLDKSKVIENNAFWRLKYSLVPGLMAA